MAGRRYRNQNSAAIVSASGMRAIQDTNKNGIADQYEGVVDAQYRVVNQNPGQKYKPIYQVDAAQMFSTFSAIRIIASAVRHRGLIALAELAIAGYVILAGSAFGLNMLSDRPMRLTNVPIFDPTATGANLAWFMRPVVGTAAGMGLDAQVDMFGSEDAEVHRQQGLDRGKYAVEWEE